MQTSEFFDLSDDNVSERFPGGRTMSVTLQTRTNNGSFFGMNEEGETVFLNNRIAVASGGLEEGDSVAVYAVPNFEDKRDNVQWRTIRTMGVVAPMSTAEKASLEALILRHLTDVQPTAGSETLAKVLGHPLPVVDLVCRALLDRRLVTKAVVFHGQTGFSHVVWGLEDETFEWEWDGE